MTEEQVIALLKDIQGEETNCQFAERLGVHNSYLSKVYHGKIPIGRALVEGLARLCPERREELALFLLCGLQTCRRI